VPGFDVETWFTLIGPAGIPQAFVDGTYQALEKIMARPAVQERLVALGARPDLQDPARSRAFIESEARRWLPIIKEAGIRVG
jgi:tripartite-type tricarboxylate transporter receptor subunit TctC